MWRFALFYPERIIALASVCIPYDPPRAEWMSLDDAQKINARLNYQIYFCTDKAEKEIDENLDLFMKTMYLDPSNPTERLPVNVFKLASRTRSYFEGLDPNMKKTAMFTEAEYNEYLRTWKEDMKGFNGALQFYRTRREDWEAERAIMGRGIDVPALFVGCAIRCFRFIRSLTKSLFVARSFPRTNRWSKVTLWNGSRRTCRSSRLKLASVGTGFFRIPRCGTRSESLWGRSWTRRGSKRNFE